MTISRIPSVEGGIQPTLLTAKGDLISATAASTVARLAVGSDAQILVADSTASTGLKWATPASGGGMTLLTSGSLSGTTTTASFTSTGYKQVVIFVKDASCTTDWYFQLRINGDTGSNYNFINQYISASGTANTIAVQTSTQFYNDGSIEATDNNVFAVYTIEDPANTTTRKLVSSYCIYRDATNTFNATGTLYGQWFATPAAVTSVTFNPSSTFSTGTYEVYGVA